MSPVNVPTLVGHQKLPELKRLPGVRRAHRHAHNVTLGWFDKWQGWRQKQEIQFSTFFHLHKPPARWVIKECKPSRSRRKASTELPGVTKEFGLRCPYLCCHLRNWNSSALLPDAKAVDAAPDDCKAPPCCAHWGFTRRPQAGQEGGEPERRPREGSGRPERSAEEESIFHPVRPQGPAPVQGGGFRLSHHRKVCTQGSWVQH